MNGYTRPADVYRFLRKVNKWRITLLSADRSIGR
jgi:hypothetical protein